MERVVRVLAAAEFAGQEAADLVALDFDRRHRRRIVLETAGGRALLLDLPKARHLRHGEGLILADGTAVRVEALPEPVMDIAAAPDELLRIAWHLGNRHLPTQLLPTQLPPAQLPKPQLPKAGLRLRDDHVIAEMVEGLGGQVTRRMAAFDPEGGAYAAAHLSHQHAHDDDHGHAHNHDHGHAHAHAHDHG